MSSVDTRSPTHSRARSPSTLQVLRFSRVLESSAPEECILPAHAVDLPDAVPDLSNTVVEVSDDEMDAFDTLTVAPFSRQPQPTPTEHPGEVCHFSPLFRCHIVYSTRHCWVHVQSWRGVASLRFTKGGSVHSALRSLRNHHCACVCRAAAAASGWVFRGAGEPRRR